MSTVLVRSNGDRIIIDATTQITKSLPNRVTSHPIEDGTTITDHIVNDPRTFSIQGLISDASFAIIPNDLIPLGRGRYLTAQIAIESMRDNKELLTLETPNEIFFDVVITDLSIPRDANTGESLVFNIGLQQIGTVERRFTVVPESRLADPDKGTSNAETGRQPKQNCDITRDRSALLQGIEAIGSAIGSDGTAEEKIDAALSSLCGET